MSNKEKSIHIFEFWGKILDWKNCSKKFISHGKWKSYKKLLVSSGSMSDMDNALRMSTRMQWRVIQTSIILNRLENCLTVNGDNALSTSFAKN